MSLVINHNLMAESAQRNLGATYSRLGESINALSSGLRVNSADDDAAGLAVRESMRANIAALDQGVRNANDAISMLQTFDGAAQVIDEKLVRMKELAEQAATGTYQSSQRSIMNDEFQKMASEIDRIAEATDFNGIKGLNASGTLTIHFGPGNDSAEDYYDVSKQNMQTGAGQSISSGDNSTTLTVEDGTEFTTGEKVILTDTDGTNSTTVKYVQSVSGNDVTIDSASGWGGSGEDTIAAAGVGTSPEEDADVTQFGSATEGWVDVANADVFSEGDVVTLYSTADSGHTDTTVTVDAVNEGQDRLYLTGVDSGGQNFENAAAADTYITANDGGVGSSGLGLASADISTQSNAQSALTALDSAITTKDEARAHFGAMINRLKNTVAAEQIQRQNLQAAESQISDVDVASEMTQLTRNQVMAQAGVSALIQANSVPQMALSLLGG